MTKGMGGGRGGGVQGGGWGGVGGGWGQFEYICIKTVVKLYCTFL